MPLFVIMFQSSTVNNVTKQRIQHAIHCATYNVLEATVYICTSVCLIILSHYLIFRATLGVSDHVMSFLYNVNAWKNQPEKEMHLCSAVSRKSGEALKGTGMCGKRTLVECAVPH